MEMSVLSSAILVLIRQYLGRQQLAVKALHDLRPDLVMLSQQMSIEQILLIVEKYSQVSSVGYWGADNEWEYFIHGGGCRLVHRKTKEPIDCNTPEAELFDPYKFSIWLHWLLNKENHEYLDVIRVSLKEQFRTIEVLVANTFNELEQAERIRALSPYKSGYVLVSA